jgi:hypothetical protein
MIGFLSSAIHKVIINQIAVIVVQRAVLELFKTGDALHREIKSFRCLIIERENTEITGATAKHGIGFFREKRR